MKFVRTLIVKLVEKMIGATIPSTFASWEDAVGGPYNAKPNYRCRFFERELQDVEKLAWT